MKIFITFAALLAVASASHLYLASAPSVTPPLIVPAAVSNQYHSQDGLGQYAYAYNDHLSSKQEIKYLNGFTQGSYSYIDSNNVLQTVDYIADDGGFRVAATNLPKPVEVPVVAAEDLPKQVYDTSEVAAAKSAHFAAIEEAKKQAASEVLLQAPFELPQPIEDTPEIAAAKAVHLAAIEEAKKQNVQVVLIPSSAVELPRPVEDTPEVAKAKAEHLYAIEQAKLRNSFPNIDSGISLVQNAPRPLVISPITLQAYSSLPFSPSSGFSYSSSVINSPVIQYVRYV